MEMWRFEFVELQRSLLLHLRMISRRKTWAAMPVLLVILMRDFRVDSITCLQTEYKIGEECCPMCPIGQRVKADCTEFETTSCSPCTDGTFMDQASGLKRCNPCSTCDSGAGLKEKQQCKRYVDTVCEPMEGFYCTDFKSRGCVVAQKHRSCEPGHYISRMGTASTDTECSECSRGSFSNGTMFSCQPHTQCEKENLHLIKAGTTSTDAECGEKSSKIKGVVISVVVVLFLVGASIGGVFLWKHKKNKEQSSCTNQPQGGEAEQVSLNVSVQETQN
ncbi:tumor necrosis factor receptor superfamily member 14-like [Gambusia affinis]|uniref:tumor necrosis factor receptor superfamily member 14-like n=1 Tax=Gambusia affinis TaxID=33528 RepID=UPI001CDD52B2|nr:tumor necrosis factor receptor superfamily member 14-like [Gambusia affinis]